MTLASYIRNIVRIKKNALQRLTMTRTNRELKAKIAAFNEVLMLIEEYEQAMEEVKGHVEEQLEFDPLVLGNKN